MNESPQLKVRVGTVVWGGILLVIAGIAMAAALLDLSQLGGSLVVWAIVAVGALLVVAGIAGGVARMAGRPSTDRLTNDSSGAPLP